VNRVGIVSPARSAELVTSSEARPRVEVAEAA
jgi:hypothetical protein